MMNLKLFDHYSFRARLQPALLTLLPAAIGVFAWTGPGVKWSSALWTLFGTAGGTFFLASRSSLVCGSRGEAVRQHNFFGMLALETLCCASVGTSAFPSCLDNRCR